MVVRQPGTSEQLESEALRCCLSIDSGIRPSSPALFPFLFLPSFSAQVEYCRLCDLPDLDQENSFVASTLINWVNATVSKYGFDGLRIDTVSLALPPSFPLRLTDLHVGNSPPTPPLSHRSTFRSRSLLSLVQDEIHNPSVNSLAVHHPSPVPLQVPEVSKKFWPLFHAGAGVYTMGEVFDGRIDYVASYQSVLDATLSYPMSAGALACRTSFCFAPTSLPCTLPGWEVLLFLLLAPSPSPLHRTRDSGVTQPSRNVPPHAWLVIDDVACVFPVCDVLPLLDYACPSFLLSFFSFLASSGAVPCRLLC